VIDPASTRHGAGMEVDMTSPRRILVLSFIPLSLVAAAAACSVSTEPGAGGVWGALATESDGCVVLTGEMYQACFVDDRGLQQGDVHDGGMPVLGPTPKVIFAFEPAWAPRVEDLGAPGLVTAYAGPENVQSLANPVPEDDPSHAIGASVVATSENGFTVAFDRPIADGMQVDVILAMDELYRSRIGPPCDLPKSFYCHADGRTGINTRFYVGHVPPPDTCIDPDASACAPQGSSSAPLPP
jgi:hypothetical protein